MLPHNLFYLPMHIGTALKSVPNHEKYDLQADDLMKKHLKIQSAAGTQKAKKLFEQVKKETQNPENSLYVQTYAFSVMARLMRDDRINAYSKDNLLLLEEHRNKLNDRKTNSKTKESFYSFAAMQTASVLGIQYITEVYAHNHKNSIDENTKQAAQLLSEFSDDNIESIKDYAKNEMCRNLIYLIVENYPADAKKSDLFLQNNPSANEENQKVYKVSKLIV